MEYCCEMKIIQLPNHEDTYLDEIVGAVLAFVGLYFQLMHPFNVSIV